VPSVSSAPGVPLVSSYQWDTGVQAHAATRSVHASVALTMGTLSNPRVDDDNRGRQISGRVAWQPVVGLVLGASAARGEFLSKQIADRYEPVLGKHSYPQQALGFDAEYSRGYWIVRGEIIDSRWTIPVLDLPKIENPLRADAAFVEGRYRITPRFFVAGRADRLTFSKITGQRFFGGVPTMWDAPVTRIEAGGGVYLLRNLTLRGVVQRNVRDGGKGRSRTYEAAQLAYWF
jgi:hypothetical protein